jgi:hypothetical protein
MSGVVFWERCARIALILGISAIVAEGPARRVQAQDRPAAAGSKTAHVRQEHPTMGSRISPWIQNAMNPSLAAKLRSAINLAADHLEIEEACRGLFAVLGADGTATIAGSTYFHVPNHYLETTICDTRHAYTYVGGGPVWVCRNFQWLSTEQAAAVVIHEALHHAGLTEKPSDPHGMTSLDINRMVMKRCRF